MRRAASKEAATSRAGSAVTATMHEAGGAGVVVTQSRYDTTAEDLWEALTRPERLARWLGEVVGDLQVGGTFSATWTSTWTGTGTVEVCERPLRLRVRMSEEPEEGAAAGADTVIEATLTPQDDGVQLVVRASGLPLANLPAFGAGWQVHLEDLGHHLVGTDRTDWLERWQELIPTYRSGYENVTGGTPAPPGP